MSEHQPRYGSPEVPQPTVEQVDQLVLSAFAEHRIKGKNETDWLVRPAHDSGHPAMWRHFRIHTNSHGWTVETAQRSFNYPGRKPAERKARWGETSAGTLTLRDGQLSSEHKIVLSPRPTYIDDLFHIRPKDIMDSYGDDKPDTPEEVAQLVNYYFTVNPPISKEQAVANYRARTKTSVGEIIGIHNKEANRVLQTGSFIGRLLERFYLKRDPGFAKYPKKLS